MNDDPYLSQFRRNPRPEFTEALYEKLNPPQKPRIFSLPRFAIGFGVAVLAVGLILLVSPPARVFAQDLLQQIGQLFITDDPTYAEQYEAAHQGAAGETTASAQPPLEWQAPGLLSVAEAAELAGFEVAEITSLPADLIVVTRSVSTPDELNPFTAITTTYQSGSHTLVFKQAAYKPDTAARTLPVGEAAVVPVEVQGVQGVWIENLRLSTTVDENNQVAPQTANLLVWERDGFEFWLQSTPGYSQAEMLEIAHSVQP